MKNLQRSVFLVGSLALCGAARAAPDAHFVETEDYFVSPCTYDMHREPLRIARKVKGPDEDGLTLFRVVESGAELETPLFWRTHLARPGELKVGVLVIWTEVHQTKRLPASRAETLRRPWRIGRLVSAEPGSATVGVGEVEMPAATMRVVEGDRQAGFTFQSPEDRMFLHAEHWLISTEEDPEADRPLRVWAAVALRPPRRRGEEGEFLRLGSGEIVKTARAWRTRVARREDIKAGAWVAFFGADQELAHGPLNRSRALTFPWSLVKATAPAKEMRAGLMVPLSGGEIFVEGARVAVDF